MCIRDRLTIVKVWVVLCPSLQRTITMAGERAIEAGGATPSPGACAAGVWATAIDQSAEHEITASLDLNLMSYFLSVAWNATVLPIDPAGVETGTSRSSRCSPAEPQGMDWTRG